VAADRTLFGIEFGESLGFCGRRFVYFAPNPSWTGPVRRAILADIVQRSTKGELLGPFTAAPTDGFRTQPIFAVPKDVTRFRIIHDFSFPKTDKKGPRLSVNDCIDLSRFSMKCKMLDPVINMIMQLGPGCLMQRRDLADAYRQVVLWPEDFEICGLSFNGLCFMDTRLPFGACSSPGIFCRYADQLESVLHEKYKIDNLSHFFDDFMLQIGKVRMTSLRNKCMIRWNGRVPI